MRYIILGHSNPDVDSILSGILLEKVLNKKYNTDEYKFIIPEEHIDTTSGNIIKELGIDLDKYKDNHVDKEDLLILVDHHEEDRYSNKIISIYDHHPPTSDFIKPSIYYNTSSCSTTVIIYRLFEEYIDKDDFILVLVGALLDTVSFKSTKTNKDDVALLKERCKSYDINIDDYIEMGLCLNDISDPDKMYLNGYKKYIIEGKKVESSYVQIKDVDKNINNIDKIIDNIKKYIKDNNTDIFIFILYDMDTFKTKCYEITDESITTTLYDSYTSRGNTIIPELDKKIKLQD